VILYVDTSALVKLYVDEAGALLVRQGVQGAEVVATSEIAYVEIRAAVARRRREGALTAGDYKRLLRRLHTDWSEFLLIAVGSSLIRDAGAIAEQYRLRAYDAVHLAAGLVVQRQMEEPVTFACWDRVLAAAAAKAGMRSLTTRGFAGAL